jgi:hypothetical protein
MKTLFIITSTTLLLLTSCKVHFTESTRARIQEDTDLQLSQVQFYNDKPIKLEYKSASKNDNISKGKVRFKDGYFYHELKIKRHTKAIIKESVNHELLVFFENGQYSYLTFVPDPSSNHYYLVLPNDTNDKVSYDRQLMKIKKGKDTRLKVKAKHRSQHKKNKRKAKGVKL